MANLFNIPLISPFKFVKVANVPGPHFDDAWFCEQIKSWELPVIYRQKWQRSDTTKLQIETTLAPADLTVFDRFGVIRKLLIWNQVFNQIWETTFDIHDLPEGVYYMYQKVAFGVAIKWESLSQPIESRDSWPGTLLFNYWHDINDYDVAWVTGIRMNFRCEACIPQPWMQPERDRTISVSQTRNVRTTNAVPYRTHKLYVGEVPGVQIGVAPYMVDILNRILVCNNVLIEGKAYQNPDAAKFNVTRLNGYPLIIADIDITEAFNNQSIQFQDASTISPGIVTAYNIETGFFGPGSLVPVTEVQKQG